MSVAEGTGKIVARLNGEALFSWSGNLSRLQKNFVMNLTTAKTLGLAVQQSSVTFHRATLKASRGLAAFPPKTSPSPAARKPGDGDLLAGLGAGGNSGWEAFNGGAFVRATEDGRAVVRSLPNRGSGDLGAYLSGRNFSEGTIEVELQGSSRPGGSFVGVVFHGVDGETYDSVYFRPFNFGHRDSVRRGHAVQYMSHPDWRWDKLRSQRPEEFENPARSEPGPDDWFKAKIEVRGKRVRVYVNDASAPCLDV